MNTEDVSSSVSVNPFWVTAPYSLALIDKDGKILDSQIGPFCHLRFDEESRDKVMKAIEKMDWAELQRLSIKPYIRCGK